MNGQDLSILLFLASLSLSTFECILPYASMYNMPLKRAMSVELLKSVMNHAELLQKFVKHGVHGAPRKTSSSDSKKFGMTHNRVSEERP